jgi:hypothetical protein
LGRPPGATPSAAPKHYRWRLVQAPEDLPPVGPPRQRAVQPHLKRVTGGFCYGYRYFTGSGPARSPAAITSSGRVRGLAALSGRQRRRGRARGRQGAARRVGAWPRGASCGVRLRSHGLVGRLEGDETDRFLHRRYGSSGAAGSGRPPTAPATVGRSRAGRPSADEPHEVANRTRTRDRSCRIPDPPTFSSEGVIVPSRSGSASGVKELEAGESVPVRVHGRVRLLQSRPLHHVLHRDEFVIGGATASRLRSGR